MSKLQKWMCFVSLKSLFCSAFFLSLPSLLPSFHSQNIARNCCDFRICSSLNLPPGTEKQRGGERRLRSRSFASFPLLRLSLPFFSSRASSSQTNPVSDNPLCPCLLSAPSYSAKTTEQSAQRKGKRKAASLLRHLSFSFQARLSPPLCPSLCLRVRPLPACALSTYVCA